VSRGFTLIELMAVVFLTALVLGAAADSYLDISRASQAALDQSREAREAVGILDRMARDLEGTVLLVKPAELDPLLHPWLFLAEAESEADGAQRLKFVTRSHRPRASDAPESDLAVVAFVAETGEEGTLVLRRSLTPGLPEELDRSFPRDDPEGADVLADGLARFGMRFLGEEGEWLSSFDSSTLVQSGQLPLAVEIELAFAHEDPDGALEEGPLYLRQVTLPLRPLDLEEELGGEEDADTEGEPDDDEDTADCITVQECVAGNPARFSDLGDIERLGDLDRCIEDAGISEEDCQP
jgi:prepilin-type N-terminal cleavage/methylation domain-containing protein